SILMFNWRVSGRISRVTDLGEKAERELDLLTGVLRRVGAESFSGPRLRSLQESLRDATLRLEHLARLIQRLQSVRYVLILALAGAPVRSRRLAISSLALGATIRVQDSLQGGMSRFYAEISRIKQMMELATGPSPLLFLLEEVLAGTNSQDRKSGAEILLREFIARNAIGLVTTHDLALAGAADTLGGAALNVHFEDQLVDGKLAFDYVLRPGVVTKSNALALMRSIGLLDGNGGSAPSPK